MFQKLIVMFFQAFCSFSGSEVNQLCSELNDNFSEMVAEKISYFQSWVSIVQNSSESIRRSGRRSKYLFIRNIARITFDSISGMKPKAMYVMLTLLRFFAWIVFNFILIVNCFHFFYFGVFPKWNFYFLSFFHRKNKAESVNIPPTEIFRPFQRCTELKQQFSEVFSDIQIISETNRGFCKCSPMFRHFQRWPESHSIWIFYDYRWK